MRWGITFVQRMAYSPIASPVCIICKRNAGEAAGGKVVLQGKNHARLRRPYAIALSGRIICQLFRGRGSRW